MKKEPLNTRKQAMFTHLATDRVSKYLLIGAVAIFSLSIIMMANLAFANGANTLGALIKVNNQLDGNAFGRLNADVKSVSGNVLAIDMARADFAQLTSIKGVCATHADHLNAEARSTFDAGNAATRYGNADVVVGILDNSGIFSLTAMSELKKVESGANIGFISYVSNDPNSTVIMRNLKGGESNLVQALSYMREYARTVEKPLVVEMVLDGKEMKNPLFVQVCQRMADAGIQFLGNGADMGMISGNRGIQLAFTMYNSSTGQITDRSSYWSISEVMDQELMLMGSDEQNCSFSFNTEAGFEKVHVSNASDDVVMVTAISEDGLVHYYNVENKETALIPRTLFNGLPVLEDGIAGIFPYLSKKAMFNGADNDNRMVALSTEDRVLELNFSDMGLSVSGNGSEILGMRLENIERNLIIEITDRNGEVVYLNNPDRDIQSIEAEIDLSDGADGLYFLNLTSPQFQQTFALLMD